MGKQAFNILSCMLWSESHVLLPFSIASSIHVCSLCDWQVMGWAPITTDVYCSQIHGSDYIHPSHAVPALHHPRYLNTSHQSGSPQALHF